MGNKIIRIKVTCLLFAMCAAIYACAEQPVVFDGEFLERKLAQPFVIEGILTQNGEQYEVAIEAAGNFGGGDFKIRFLSGDVTEGLTIEFFETGVFLFFDDFRFRTNSETFTNLEALKNSFELLAAAYIEKYVLDFAPVDGLDLVEIGVHSENGDVRAHINQLDGSVMRLATTLNGADITLDIRKFANVIQESQTEDAGGIAEVTGGYAESDS